LRRGAYDEVETERFNGDCHGFVRNVTVHLEIRIVQRFQRVIDILKC
jgi:hypothetical protein